MKKLIVGLVLFASSAEGAVGVNSGLTSLYVSGNEISVTSASTNSIKTFRFLAPSILTQIGSAFATDKEPIYVSVSDKN